MRRVSLCRETPGLRRPLEAERRLRLSRAWRAAAGRGFGRPGGPPGRVRRAGERQRVGRGPPRDERLDGRRTHDVKPGTADRLPGACPLELGPLQARQDPVPDEVTLEFRDSRQHVEEEAPGRRRRVDSLVEGHLGARLVLGDVASYLRSNTCCHTTSPLGASRRTAKTSSLPATTSSSRARRSRSGRRGSSPARPLLFGHCRLHPARSPSGPVPYAGQREALISPRPLVLVIDDSAETRKLYALVLELEGYVVAQARDGQDGLEQARDLVPDIIITDLAMPIMDGWETTSRLRADPSTRHIPIIACSGDGAGQRMDRAAPEVLLAKPCPLDMLVAEVRRLLQRAA
jgi:CheY-like chemotaxis protein